MISLVTNIISLFALTVQKLILITSFVGQVIVATVTGISTAVCDILHYVLIFFHIIYEDNLTIFTDDIPNFVNHGFYTIVDQVISLQNSLLYTYQGLEYNVQAVIFSIKHFANGVLLVVIEVFILVKNGVIFLGNTLWLILTFVPVHLPLLLKSVLKYFVDVVVTVIVDAYMGLLKITNFFTDVPLESFIGITSTIVLFRLIVHYRELIWSQIILYYWYIVRKVLYLYHTTYNYLTNSEVRVITHMVSDHDIGSREVGPSASDDDVNAADALCVICQERQKCVLTLPCRHVCLCTECCRRLYGYQRTCPICRTFIYHSVTIYL